MIKYSITLQEEHYDLIKKHLIREDKKERIGYIICGRSHITNNPWTGSSEERFLSRDIILISDEEITEFNSSHVTWSTSSFIQALKKAELDNSIVALIHNHPDGYTQFSGVDDENEPDFFKLAFNRNGENGLYLSIIILSNGNLLGRVWTPELKKYPLDIIRVFGNSFKAYYIENFKSKTPEYFHRQELAFGKEFYKKMNRLKIAIVGCGATGSAVAVLLTRLGVGNLLLIDKDEIHATNLNRLYCANKSDIGKEKVEVICKAIQNMGLDTNVISINDWVENQKCQDALKSCDIIFGCTDDHQGRLFLNRFAYFYLIPIIDLGLMIKVSETEPPEIQALDGRMTVVYPTNTCLICKGIINIERARAEGLKRMNPDEYEHQKKEAYVIGEGEPNPAVVTFTTEVATIAVNEMIHRIQGFRGTNGQDSERRRQFHRNIDIISIDKSRDGCPICNKKQYWGRGDIEPFLDRC